MPSHDQIPPIERSLRCDHEQSASVEFTRWGHPGWGMDLLLEGGPDVTRTDAERLVPDGEANALTFSCGTMPRGEFEAVEDFSP